MTFWVKNNKVSFPVCKIEKWPMELQVVFLNDVVDMEVDDGSLDDPN